METATPDITTKIEEARIRHALALKLQNPPYDDLVSIAAHARAVAEVLAPLANTLIESKLSAEREKLDAQRSLLNVLEVLTDFDKRFTSKNARVAAQKKNQEERAFVLAEWEKNRNAFKGKADFARSYAPLLKTKFDLEITPRQIETEWLPKKGREAKNKN